MNTMPNPAGFQVADTCIGCARCVFELLCASRGLGSVMMTFPLGVLATMPDIRSLLEIPEDHYVPVMIGFGYPEIPYARGAQRKTAPDRIHPLQFPKL